MQSAFSDEYFKAPIFRPRTVAVLRMCRKRIFHEFGVKLNFTQTDLIPLIIEHATQSKDAGLRQLASELKRDFPG